MFTAGMNSLHARDLRKERNFGKSRTATLAIVSTRKEANSIFELAATRAPQNSILFKQWGIA